MSKRAKNPQADSSSFLSLFVLCGCARSIKAGNGHSFFYAVFLEKFPSHRRFIPGNVKGEKHVEDCTV